MFGAANHKKIRKNLSSLYRIVLPIDKPDEFLFFRKDYLKSLFSEIGQVEHFELWKGPAKTADILPLKIFFGVSWTFRCLRMKGKNEGLMAR